MVHIAGHQLIGKGHGTHHGATFDSQSLFIHQAVAMRRLTTVHSLMNHSSFGSRADNQIEWLLMKATINAELGVFHKIASRKLVRLTRLTLGKVSPLALSITSIHTAQSSLGVISDLIKYGRPIRLHQRDEPTVRFSQSKARMNGATEDLIAIFAQGLNHQMLIGTNSLASGE